MAKPAKAEETTVPVAPKAPEAPKPLAAAPVAKLATRYQIPSKRVSLAEQVQNRYAAVIESGRKYEDVFEPAFWAHVAERLKVGDVIEVRNDEQTYFAMLYVRDCDRLWARVDEIVKRDFEQSKSENTIEGISVEHKGPHLKFCVYRNTDRAMLQSGFATRVDALTWAVNNRRQNAA
jgi:hypothetical protein